MKVKSTQALTRRQFVGACVVASTTAGVALPSRSADMPPMKVNVHFQGKVFEYEMRSAQHLGDFRSEIGSFTQQCFRATHAECPLVIYFRPDNPAVRMEIVFELGDIWDDSPAHMDGYLVTISNGEETLEKIEVPKHFWFSRWRWQSEPRPVVGDVSPLIDDGLLPPYKIGGNVLSGAIVGSSTGSAAESGDQKAVKGLPKSYAINLQSGKLTEKGSALGLGSKTFGRQARVAESYTIMGLAGVTPQMGRTGERPDIGMVTEPQAEYIITGSTAALAVLRAQAEAAGTVPWHMRDGRSGALADLEAYPTMSWYGSPKDDPAVATLASDIQIDSAHQPALAYLPYLLTGDPYHLEDLQFAANWNRGHLPPGYRLSIPQVRAYAWSLRTLAQCAKVSPENTPSWLMPRSYWQRDLERHREWFTQTFVVSQDPLHSVFRSPENVAINRDEGPKAPQGSHISPWQGEFLASVLGWIVLMGFEDWRPVFLWKLGSTINRCSGQSGWQRGHSSPYRLMVRRSSNDPFFTSWAQAWAVQSDIWNWAEDNPDQIVDEDLSPYIFSRGALVFGKYLNVSGADNALAWINGELARRDARIHYKWQLA